MRKLTQWHKTGNDLKAWLTQLPFPNWFSLQFSRISGNGNLKGRQQMPFAATRDSGETRIHFYCHISLFRAHENDFVYSKEIISNLIKVFKITFFKFAMSIYFPSVYLITYLSCTIILLDVRERFHNVIISNHQNCSNFTIKLLTAFR